MGQIQRKRMLAMLRDFHKKHGGIAQAPKSEWDAFLDQMPRGLFVEFVAWYQGNQTRERKETSVQNR